MHKWFILWLSLGASAFAADPGKDPNFLTLRVSGVYTFPGVSNIYTLVDGSTQVSSADNLKHYTVAGTGAVVEFELPSLAEGLTFTFSNPTTRTVRLVPQAGDQILQLTALPGERLACTSKDSAVDVIGFSGLGWVVTRRRGTWENVH